MNSISRAILKTLVYGDLFSCGLTLEGFHKFLISDVAVSLVDLTFDLDLLREKGQIDFEDGFYFLPSGRQSLSNQKEKRRVSEEKIKGITKWVRTLSFFPWIKMVGITGALSYYNSRVGDDVDLMIVTSKGRMWLTRFLVFTFLKMVGRKRGEITSSIGNKICVNVFCDEDNFSVPEIERDLVVAYDLAHLIPVVDKGGTYAKLIQSNLWIKIFLANWRA